MKLRTRGPPRRVDEDEVVPVVEASSSRRRPATRKSMAPRAAPEPTPVRSRPRTAPKGGVQKRKSVRPAATRPRAAAPTPSRSSRRTARPPPAADSHPEDEADGLADEEAAAAIKIKYIEDEDNIEEEEVEEKEKRVVKAGIKTTIDDLPEEVMLGVFSYFRPPQLCWKIGRVCRRWASWSVSPFLWRGKEYTLSPDPNLSSRRKGKA